MSTIRHTGAADETTAQADTSFDSDRAAEIRNALTDKLRAGGMITSDVVERAFRTVPRHLFVAEGTPLEVTYNVDNAVAIKRDRDGVIISSTSAAYIQAQMIEQAGLGPGMSVLEIGSGGYNAALLAEVVGSDGQVVSVDIDPEVTDRARELLDTTGYGSRVTVVQADAENPLPGLDEPFDAILVTVGAWDLAPAWLEHLSAGGSIVVPLRMNGITRVIAFRREGDHLVAELLQRLNKMGAAEQATKLAERAAAGVHLDDARGVACLLELLHEVGATEQATRLAERAAVGVGLGETFGVATLVRQLDEIGATEQIARLAERLPAAGFFGLFLRLVDDQGRFRFGMEPNKSLADTWTWEDLK